MRIGDVNLSNIRQYSSLFRKMEEGDPYSSVDIDNFSRRFDPIDIPFVKPDWSKIATKRDNPFMSEAEFEKEIVALAQEAFANRDNSTIERYIALRAKHQEVASPDRKAAYEASMRKTGGKMNAAVSFYDTRGRRILSYHTRENFWVPIATDAEISRTKVFNSIYNGEFDRLRAKYGRERIGNISLKEIRGDIERAKPKEAGLGEKIDLKV